MNLDMNALISIMSLLNGGAIGSKGAESSGAGKNAPDLASILSAMNNSSPDNANPMSAILPLIMNMTGTHRREDNGGYLVRNERDSRDFGHYDSGRYAYQPQKQEKGKYGGGKIYADGRTERKRSNSDMYATPFAEYNSIGITQELSSGGEKKENPLTNILPMLMNLMGAKSGVSAAGVKDAENTGGTRSHSSNSDKKNQYADYGRQNSDAQRSESDSDSDCFCKTVRYTRPAARRTPFSFAGGEVGEIMSNLTEHMRRNCGRQG